MQNCLGRVGYINPKQLLRKNHNQTAYNNIYTNGWEHGYFIDIKRSLIVFNAYILSCEIKCGVMESGCYGVKKIIDKKKNNKKNQEDDVKTTAEVEDVECEDEVE